MIGPNEFWLSLHQLAEAYASEGLSPQERRDAILADFERLSPLVRRQLLGDFRLILENLPELEPLVDRVLQEDDSAMADRGNVA